MSEQPREDLEEMTMRAEAGQTPLGEETRPVAGGAGAVDIAWRVEGDDPERYLDLEASLDRFRDLAAEALRREGIMVDRVPVTIMLNPVIDTRGQVSDPEAVRAYDVVSNVWELGEWKVPAQPGEKRGA
ncbi:MAG: hypothetical protein IRY97_05560 [Thermomicrobiaceae bacterium]|nr:hypothetical protein [Thermomicrobiaceae bacterium]